MVYVFFLSFENYFRLYWIFFVVFEYSFDIGWVFDEDFGLFYDSFFVNWVVFVKVF